MFIKNFFKILITKKLGKILEILSKKIKHQLKFLQNFIILLINPMKV